MDYDDKTINCIDCGQDFTFTASEQEFFASKGFENEPKRCPACRRAKKEARNRMMGAESHPRQMHQTVCAECGSDTEVPFEPREGRPVYCNECFAKRRDSVY
ncbi:zinc-ribbon domain containing protein [Chloroflexota bacterium]